MHYKYTNNIQSLNITITSEECNALEYKKNINEVWSTDSERLRIFIKRKHENNSLHVLQYNNI